MVDRSFFDACDGIFLNYTWNDDNLQTSRELALQSGRPYDVYVGVDVYGRGCRGGGGFNTKEVCLSLAIVWSFHESGSQYTLPPVHLGVFIVNMNKFLY